MVPIMISDGSLDVAESRPANPRVGRRPSRLKLSWLLAGLLAAAVGLLASGCRSTDAENVEQATKDMVPVSTPEQYQREVLEARTPVLVDFYATWCPPCQILSPRLGRMATEYKGRAKFVKVDVDRAGQLAGEHGIQSFPTVVLVINGRQVQRWVGLRDESVYRRALEAALGGRYADRKERERS